MATYYWVGGTGTWDSSTTTNWSLNSGSSGGAGVPTSADDVVFDSASNATAYTVTINTGAVCRDVTIAGPASGNVTVAGTGSWAVHGSLIFPATGMTRTYTGTITFAATSTGKTITTNGVSLGAAPVVFNGVGGAWSLGSAFTSTSSITVTNGSFSTSNNNLTASSIVSSNSNTRSIYFGSSTVAFSATTAINFTTSTNLTFDAGTSNITLSAASADIYGDNLTFYNVTFSSTARSANDIFGANTTFNNLTLAARTTTGISYFQPHGDMTVTGTFTIGDGGSPLRRTWVLSGEENITATVTVGTMATLVDVDFSNILAAGASTPWSGTRLGDGGNNANITFDAPKTVYWNLAAGGSWTSTAWATTPTGTPNVNNLPLVHDVAVISDTGLNTNATVTLNVSWLYPLLDISSRTNAMTLANSTNTPYFAGDVRLSSAVTVTGTGIWYFFKRYTTFNLQTSGVTIPAPIRMNSAASSLKLVDALTISNYFYLFAGNLDLNANNLTSTQFLGSSEFEKSVHFGTNKIILTGNNAIIWDGPSTGQAEIKVTGTPIVECTYSGSTGTRTLDGGLVGIQTEANAISFKITAGTDIVRNTGSHTAKDLDFTGFSGSFNPNTIFYVYGDITYSATMTTTSTTNSVYLGKSATYGNQGFVTNGITINHNILKEGDNTWELSSALTLGSINFLNINNGTFTTNNYNITTGAFRATSTSNRTRILNLGSSTITITWTSTSAAVFNIANGNSENVTLNAGTSIINIQATGTGNNGCYFGPYTYNNVTVGHSAAGADAGAFRLFLGNPTFNNFTLFGRDVGATRNIQLNPNTNGEGRSLIVTGTFATSATAPRREVEINTVDQYQYTFTAANVSLSDIYLASVVAAGASTPWSGTRLSDVGSNENITFSSPQTYYWNLPAGGDFHTDACLATTSGGTVNINNYPLAQDTVVFNNAGLNSGSIVTFSQRILQGIDASALTNSATFDIQSGVLVINKFKLSSSITLVNDPAFIWFFGIRSYTHLTQCEVSTLGIPISSEVRLFNAKLYSDLVVDNTVGFRVGKADFNGYNVTCDTLSNAISTNSPVKPEAYLGTGTITSTEVYLRDSDALFFTEDADIVLDVNKYASADFQSPSNYTWKSIHIDSSLKVPADFASVNVQGDGIYIEELTNTYGLSYLLIYSPDGTPNNKIYIKNMRVNGSSDLILTLDGGSGRPSALSETTLVNYGETNFSFKYVKFLGVVASPSTNNYWYAPVSLGNEDYVIGGANPQSNSGVNFSDGYSNNAMGVFL